MAIRLVFYALSKRWSWLGVGLIVFIVGAVIYSTAHTPVPTEISGTLEHARQHTQDGSYEYTEVTLVGDPNTYTFTQGDMTPAGVDDNFWTSGKVDLWVNQGTTDVLAIQLYGKDNKTPTKYVTDYYVHPESKLASDRSAAEFVGGFGGFMLLVGLVWPVFPWGRKKAAHELANDGAANWSNPSFQYGYGQPHPPEAYVPQRPGYGQSPVQQMEWQQPYHPSYGPPSPYQQPYSGPPSQYGETEQYGQPPYSSQGQFGQPGPQSGWGRQQPPPYPPSRQPNQDGWDS